MTTHPARLLRELINGDELVIAPGVYDGLTATLVERAGFPAAYVSGASASVSVLGRPDLGLMSAGEVAAHVVRLRGATSLPLIVDIDTGYGNELNVRHAVETHVRLGAAAVHIEDQVFPKRCGHLNGKTVVGKEEAVRKVRAAVAARGSHDLVIIARTDALTPLGLDEAIDRGRRFADAGADMVFVEAPGNPHQLDRIARSIDVPLVINVIANSRTPLLTASDYAGLGYRLGIYPFVNIAAASAAVDSALTRLRETGLPPRDAAGPAELFGTVGLDDWLQWPDRLVTAQPPSPARPATAEEGS
ncbi:isocitrate lyase/PEP mutase family protein [Streptomyces sp. NPDC045470]|uniref:isocitrate lyase/PEP mutase family protein n=1 Tax=unclassified Streptomyces TaxID=2593676 RepID=UPI0033FE9591